MEFTNLICTFKSLINGLANCGPRVKHGSYNQNLRLISRGTFQFKTYVFKEVYKKKFGEKTYN